MGLKVGPCLGISPPSSPTLPLTGDSVNHAVSPGLPVTAQIGEAQAGGNHCFGGLAGMMALPFD